MHGFYGGDSSIEVKRATTTKSDANEREKTAATFLSGTRNGRDIQHTHKRTRSTIMLSIPFSPSFDCSVNRVCFFFPLNVDV